MNLKGAETTVDIVDPGRVQAEAMNQGIDLNTKHKQTDSKTTPPVYIITSPDVPDIMKLWAVSG